MAAAICAAIAVPAMAQTNYPGGGAAIPNQGAATVFPIQFFVGDTGFITDLNFSILGLTHTFAADLEIALVAPDGTNAWCCQSKANRSLHDGAWSLMLAG